MLLEKALTDLTCLKAFPRAFFKGRKKVDEQTRRLLEQCPLDRQKQNKDVLP